MIISALGTLEIMNHVELRSHTHQCVPRCTQKLVLIWKGPWTLNRILTFSNY